MLTHYIEQKLSDLENQTETEQAQTLEEIEQLKVDAQGDFYGHWYDYYSSGSDILTNRAIKMMQEV